jgi:hypothetical protein
MEKHRALIRAALAAVALIVALAMAVGLAEAASPNGLPLTLTAAAINLGNRAPAANASLVEIKIDRWSTEQERQALIAAFHNGGPDKLLSALREAPRVGYLRTPDSVAWDLHYAREVRESDGSRRIILGTDRRMGFWELANNARSVNYPFTLIEIHLDPSGKGEGRMSLATKVTTGGDGQQLQLENYSAEPVRLQSVRVQTR